MKIGGVDTLIEGAPACGEGIFLVQQLSKMWPGLVAQDVDADHCFVPGRHNRTVGALREFFVYRSSADFALWKREGYTAENAPTMIHVIFGNASATVVAEPGFDMEAIVRAVIERRGRMTHGVWITCPGRPDQWMHDPFAVACIVPCTIHRWEGTESEAVQEAAGANGRMRGRPTGLRYDARSLAE